MRQKPLEILSEDEISKDFLERVRANWDDPEELASVAFHEVCNIYDRHGYFDWDCDHNYAFMVGIIVGETRNATPEALVAAFKARVLVVDIYF